MVISQQSWSQSRIPPGQRFAFGRWNHLHFPVPFFLLRSIVKVIEMLLHIPPRYYHLRTLLTTFLKD